MPRNIRKFNIYGLVQGVGFRPFVSSVADRLSLSGYVKNDGGIVTVLLGGASDDIDVFVSELSSLDGASEKLPGAYVERIEEIGFSEDEAAAFSDSFEIIESTSGEDRIRMLPPDIATCDKCLEELFDSSNRRYRHPFISCTACGPRYTIMSDIPYDRERTTMVDFPMCRECEDEYDGRILPGAAVRHYAQTICCNDCGPKLFATDGERTFEGEEAFALAVRYLREEKIVAVKDVGGYHFCFDAFSETADSRLREWKNRERKPFAVMFRDVEEIRQYAEVSDSEEELLTSVAAPIVLLKTTGIPPEKCPDGRSYRRDREKIGAFLPSNGLQHMLLREISPLVMTSGNRGGEPIITDDEEMMALLKTGVPDLVLYNDRKILYGLDDSIYQVTTVGEDEIVQIIRRARGIVPSPIWINGNLPCDTFAAGGDLKSVFALGRKNAVYLSGHFGDLDDASCMAARERSITHMKKLLGITPEAYICDKHPLYKSVVDNENRIQHHFAHILSVAAEHDLKGQVLGVAFDGTGYGDDGTIWGGEFLLCDMDAMSYTRAGHLKPVEIIGGDESAKDAKKTAFCMLYESGIAIDEMPQVAKHLDYGEAESRMLCAALDKKINTVKNSSMGRLFDAAAAILKISDYNSYEGECPIALQYAAEVYKESEHGKLPNLKAEIIEENGSFITDTPGLLKALYEAYTNGYAPEAAAYAFHVAVAEMTADMCKLIMDKNKISSIALSGGTMQNALLLKLLLPRLNALKLAVYLNEQVPPGDGGIALGQIYATIK